MTNAEEAILRICRSGKRTDGKTSQNGLWCMRELDERNPKAAQGRCVVVDNARWNVAIVAQGSTWEDVLQVLP